MIYMKAGRLTMLVGILTDIYRSIKLSNEVCCR